MDNLYKIDAEKKLKLYENCKKKYGAKGRPIRSILAKTLGAQWGKLNTKQRKPFANAAEKSKSTYEKDMSEYNEKNGL